MNPPPTSLKLELILRADHPELLNGLDYWLQLGLLSAEQIEQLGRSLSSPLPQTQESTTDFLPTDFLPTDFLPTASTPSIAPASSPSWLTQILSSFMAEISVVWLLFLGVFMVVVSSGVLAASQWRNFSTLGQYAILWSYTLAFGIAGLWTGQRPRLRMTGRMLQIATLLIVPVNFWMIDEFKIWGTSSGWILAAIASLSLSFITIHLLKQSPRLTLINQLALCGLHWGWGIPGWALAATYGATIGTAGLQIRGQSEAEPRMDIGKVAIVFSTLLILGRALFVKQIPIDNLGLAFGICGWLLVWLNRQQRPIWNPVGMGLLFIGWAVTVASDQWQALGVSVLGLWLLGDRLRRYWRKFDLVLLILVGLQTSYLLLGVVFPPSVRRDITVWLTEIVGLKIGAAELAGLGLFGYVLILLAGIAYLRRLQQLQLAALTDRFALGLGIVLFIPGGWNAWVRVLYLLLSTVTLGVLSSQRSQEKALVYLTHVTGLFTILSWIYWISPNLSIPSLALILLGMGAAEWGFCAMGRQRQWQESARYAGLALIVANLLLLTNWVVAAIAAQQSVIWQVPLAGGLSILAIALRQYRYPADLGLFGIAWAVELLVLSLGSWEQRAIGNLALGLGTQFGGDLWLRRNPEHPAAKWTSLFIIPFVYSLLGVLFAHSSFTVTTGLYTLAAALAFIGIGRRQVMFEPLTYLGIGGIAIAVSEILYWRLPEGIYLGWGGAIACLLALFFYFVPWHRWGWRQQPWQQVAIGLPIITFFLTYDRISLPTLFIIAAFYAWIAQAHQRIRLSYVGIIPAIRGAAWVLNEQTLLTHPLWDVSVISAAILYVAQVEPGLQPPGGRNARHLLRCLAVGLLGITALYQPNSWSEGLLTIALALGLVAIGLILRVRAYLFIGTLIFLAQVLKQLWLFIADYSMMLWGLGIALGLILIWVAATFEARRSQTIAWLQYWATELEQWE
jgi:hypothetical protein